MLRVLTLSVLVNIIANGASITSGDIFFGGSIGYANLTGSNFQASIADYSIGPFMHGGFAPFLAPTWYPQVNGVGIGSHIIYNGTNYAPFSLGLPPSLPFASLSFSITPISSQSQPMITGPGSYPITFSVQLNFCLMNRAIGSTYCGSDVGTATGAFNFVADANVSSWLWLSNNGLHLDIVPPDDGIQAQIQPQGLVHSPEPSTLSCIGLAFLSWLAFRACRRYRKVL